MSSMKKLMIAGATALTLSAGAAVSAHAQQLNTPYVDSLDWRITDAAERGRISWGEARQLRRELSRVKPLAWKNQTGEITRWEYRRLADTVQRIEMRTTRYAHRGGQRYGYGYGERHEWRR